MKYNIYLVILTVIFATFTGCTPKEESSIQSLSIICKEECDVKDAFKDIEVIPLKNNGRPFIDALLDIRRYGKYLTAKNNGRAIYLFDTDGNAISNSKSKIGHGHGEYSNPMGYSLNLYSRNFEILTPLTMYIYDEKFQFKKAIKLPSKINDGNKPNIFFDYIYDLDDHTYLLFPTCVSEDKNMIYVFDSLSGKVTKKLNYSDDIIAEITMQNQYFIPTDSALLFYPPSVGKYVYEFDTKSYNLTHKYLITDVSLEKKDSREEELRYLTSTKEEIPIRYYHAGENSMFLTKKGNSANDMCYIFYDANLTPKRIKLKKDGEYQLPILSWSYGDSFYGLTDGDNIAALMEKMGKECPDSLKEYPNIVVKYTVATSLRNF